MDSLFFWKDWQKSHQITYIFILSLLAICLGWYMVQYTVGEQGMGWKVKTESELIDIPVDTIQKGIARLGVKGDSYVITEKYEVQEFSLFHWTGYFYFFILMLSSIVLLTVFSTLKRFWYAVGMTLFILYVISLQFNYLVPISFYENTFLVTALVLILSISYYFQAYSVNTPFHSRLIAFSLIFLVLAIWLYSASTVSYPVLYLINQGMILILVLSLLFITIVAIDIPNIFVYILSKYSPKSARRNNLGQYIFISTIYLANLYLIHLKDIGMIHWDIFYIDIYWVFAFSVVLGIWGYASRNLKAQESFFPFRIQGAFFYLSMAMICLSTMAYSFATGNESMIKVFRDFILYTHISFGTIFFCYILINFGPLFLQNLPVYKVTYKGDVFSFNLARFIGITVICVFFMSYMEKDFFRTRNAYFQGIGDLYILEGEDILAEEYYTRALASDYNSSKTRLKLALMARKNDQPQSLLNYLDYRLKYIGNEYSYALLSDTYLYGDMFYDALFTLQEGVGKFPKSPVLNNNLALLYAQANIQDSTIYHLKMARKYSKDEIPLNNLFAYMAKEKITGLNLDSIGINTGNIISMANLIALYNVNQQKFKPELDTLRFSNTALDVKSFAYLYNFTGNRLKQKDSLNLILPVIDKVMADDHNLPIQGSLQFIKALYLYYHQNRKEGLSLISGMNGASKVAYLNNLQALWLLEQDAYSKAHELFEKSINLGDKEAIAYNAITLSEMNREEDARYYWKLALANKANGVEELAAKILKVLGDSTGASLKTDEEKFNYIYYRKKLLPDNQLNQLYLSIGNPDFKAWAATELATHYSSKDSLQKAMDIIKGVVEMKGLSFNFLTSAIKYTYWNLLWKSNEWEKLRKELESFELGRPYLYKTPFFEALLNAKENKKEEAENFFLKALLANPLDEDVLLETAAFYKNSKKDNEKAYQVLVDAIKTNPFSAKILKAYAMQCIDSGVGYYGDVVLEDIKRNTTPTDYESFVKAFEEKKKARVLFNQN